MEKQDTFRVVVLIPAYKPDDRLIQLTRELKEEKLDVLLVDDGGQKPICRRFLSSAARWGRKSPCTRSIRAKAAR